MARFAAGGDDGGTPSSSSSRSRGRHKRTRTAQVRNVPPSTSNSAIRRRAAAPISSEFDDDESRSHSGTSSHSSSSSSSGSGPESRRERRRIRISLSRSYSSSPSSSFSGEEDEDEVQPANNGNSTQSGTLVMLSDPDVLNCPICLDPLSPPVYQCENEHLACGSCSSKTRNTCPSCSMPIGYNRCRGIEKVLESAKASCRNRQRGCTVKISYGEKLEHEKSCKYTVCSCPHDDCNYVAMCKLLYTHFSVRHSNSLLNFHIDASNFIILPKDINQVFLQERHGSTLFVLNRTIEPLGSLVNVVCVAPTSSDAKYTYELTTRAGERSIWLRSYVEVTPKCSAESPKQNCLLITSDFADHLERLELQLLIRSLG